MMPIARGILRMLHRHGPLTSRELTALLRANYPTVAGVCSTMVVDRSVEEVFENGRRRGRQYKAIATMTLADRKTLKELVDDYGHATVLAHMGTQ